MAYPILSPKMDDARRLLTICQPLREGRHLQADGFTAIIGLALLMNPSGKRKYTKEEILNSLRSGEGIVCATGNGGSTRSSDLHEWRNDRITVSTSDSVKL